MNFDPEFIKACNFTLRSDIEGGYVFDPDDPGGETKYGISKKAFPKLDIKNLTLDDARKIYFDYYWTPAQCSTLAWPLNLCHFDASVNSGVSRAERFLALSKGDYKTYNGYRRSFYISLNKPKYINGWLTRINKLEIYIKSIDEKKPA